MTLTFKKGDFGLIGKVLKETDLSLSSARIRDRFLRAIATEQQSFIKDRTNIAEKFCVKLEDGTTPDIVDGAYQFSDEVKTQVDEEIKTLLSETVDIAVDEPIKLAAILNQSAYKPKIGEVDRVDEIISLLNPSKTTS